ncbi:hypothetical protein [Frankia sp. AvcI1]|uniref:hypothetical protein n=1 Tax=Frankia sp. AvcI1 TaxID=573496 RepID=UPI00211815E2|nr:hypothetical protein [Frankia sp. AvcI1]
MARRIFPDEGSRLVYQVAAALLPAITNVTVVHLYTDSAGTIAADCLDMDGNPINDSNPLLVDGYSRIPLFRGPADGTDVLYAVIAGGPPTAIYARTDDRLDDVEARAAVLGHATDAAAIAAAAGTAGLNKLVIVQEPDQGGLVLYGAQDTNLGNDIIGYDYRGAPKWWLKNAGGIGANDWIGTSRDLSQEPNNRVDIYGYRTQNALAEFSWAGPPGNMISFTNACQEHFETDRAGNKGDWVVAFGAGSQVSVLEEHPNPASSANVIQLEAHTTSMTAVTGTGFYGYPVTAGDTYSVIAHLKAVATVRSPQVGLQWFNSSGGFISQSVGSAVATNTSSYTKVTSGALTAPGGATYAAVTVYYPTTVAGELHKLSGAAMYHSTETEWSPPFVVQPFGSWGQAAVGDLWRRRTGTLQQTLYVCTTGGLPHQQVWAAAGSPGLSTSTPAATAASGSAGTATDAARSDHVHAAPQLSSTNPVALGTAAAGSATASARQDHVHPTTGLLATSALSSATPVAAASTGAAGSSSNVARADHVHPTGGTDWATYTPTLSNVTVGNGTSTGRYKLLDSKTMVFRTIFTLGSTSSITGAVAIGLPGGVTADTTVTQRAQSRAFDSSAGAIDYGIATINATSVASIVTTIGGTDVNTTVPFTWASGDTLSVWGIAELV